MVLTNFDWNLSGFGLGLPNTSRAVKASLLPILGGFSEGLRGPTWARGKCVTQREETFSKPTATTKVHKRRFLKSVHVDILEVSHLTAVPGSTQGWR